jgi:SAM-dependent methyltransferase
MLDDETRRFVLRRYDIDAYLYDAFYNPSDDIAFWLGRPKTPKASVLECACGTGRITIPLARAGHAVTGVDISEQMLKVARSKVKKETSSVQRRIRLVRADMRELGLDRTFDLCIVPFNSFHHLLTVEDQLMALSRIRDHLVLGGRLVFNLFRPNLKRPEGVQRLDKVIETGGRTLMRYSVQYFDRQNQITHGWLLHEFVEPDGLVRRQVTPFRLRYVFQNQMKRLLQQAGFRVLSVAGAYDGSRFTSNSRMMIFTAQRE